MLRRTAAVQKFLKSARPYISTVNFLTQTRGHATYARPAMLFFNFLVIMHGCAHMHGQSCIILSVQFLHLLSSPGLVSPLSLLSHNYSLIIEALSSHFVDFGPRYLKRVELA